MKVGLPCRDPGGPKCAGTWTASAAGVMALSEEFLKPPVAGDQKALLASLSPKLCPFRHLESFLAWGPLLFHSLGPKRGSPLGSYSVDQQVGHLEGHPG